MKGMTEPAIKMGVVSLFCCMVQVTEETVELAEIAHGKSPTLI